MDLSVIIVSYNTFDLTRAAIESVLANTPPPTTEIIVVDNNSPDQSGQKLVDHFDLSAQQNLTIVQLQKNIGFSAGNNVGATRATGRVLLFLNPDTIVLPGALNKLFLAAMTAGIGAVGPRVYNADKSDQKSVSHFPSFTTMIRHYLPLGALLRKDIRKSVEVPKNNESVDTIKGCAIALRRQVFEEVGGWDESYFLYSEETELCYQIKLLGYVNRFVRDAEIIHFGQASISKEDYAKQQVVQSRSALQFLQRHSSRSAVMINRVLGSLGFGIRSLVFGLIGRVGGNDDYKLRAQASRALFKFYTFDYRSS